MWNNPRVRNQVMQVIIEKQILSTMTARIHGGLSDKNFSQLGLKTLGKDTLQLSFKDRIMTILCSGVSSNKKEGCVFIQAKLFSEMVRELPPGKVILSSRGDSHIEVVAGAQQEFVMKLPQLENVQWEEKENTTSSQSVLSLPSQKLSYLIEQVQFCITQESPRNYGSVGFLHRPDKEKLRLVGTDGFRLSYCEVDLEGDNAESTFLMKAGFCVSKRGLIELSRMSNEGFDTVQLSTSEDMKTLVAEVEGYKLFITLSNINFPNYQGVVPDHKASHLNIGTNELRAVIRRILLAADKNRTIKMNLKKEKMTLSSRNVGNFEGKESILMEGYDGPLGNLFVNGKFLSDIMSSTESKEVNIRFDNDDNPVLVVPLVEPKGCFSQHVLVPIKEGN